MVLDKQAKQAMLGGNASTAQRVGRWARSLCALLVVTLGLQGTLAQAQTVYFHNDIAGSPIAATDQAGNLLWRESYRPYGERVLKPAAANAQWFHGKQTDPETGMSDFGARNYDPVLGRFLSIDPVDFQDKNIHSFNRYAYGNNNPLKYKDPDGRYADFVIEAASLTVGYLSLRSNFRSGNYRAALVDGLGIGADMVLAAVPGVPGAFGLGIKASREMGELVRGEENFLNFRSLNEARNSARQLSGLGDDAVPFVQEIGPNKGRVTGQMSPDGLRGWRIDFDKNSPKKGFHVNWWDRTAGPKRNNWFYGSNKIDGGTEDQYWQTLQHFPR
jgi:RHS repeat-associated protein